MLLTRYGFFLPPRSFSQLKWNISTVVPMSSLLLAHFLHAVNSPLILSSLIVFCSLELYRYVSIPQKTPEGVHWVGSNPNAIFAEIRVLFSAWRATRSWLTEGYKKVQSSIVGRANLLPST